ncbi:IS3 family transposase [Yersinia pseudotuberculosis]|uniref:IS3 family transposase n=1 Tax=Yersinia pseudotuberculosis TaxID=633 RepID=UPI0005E3D3A6|nr:IS3 family transposase [Yersinia pseudotuberculosis]AXY32294.1 IS3 family transposase [Yersinia pseudotuberculosis]AYX11967.1 IS3 family transposase [Yersinia pseudotuberculosis]MBO1567056.1 IS3 family transposase [Yersinia pseudotuberculosis]MBO1603915.1 IS3 family transposase [Yersinia pseudotuberculosis]PEI11865.1 IS3 family transposase [Yersinia pseudotuberculosis]
MSGKRYSEEFKEDAVRQVIADKLSVPATAAKLGITTHSLYSWIKKAGKGSSSSKPDAEISQLKKALERITDERDALKKAEAYFIARSE